MFLKTSLSPGATRASRGAALVLVLIFVVLFTGLVVAYLSQSITGRQLSNSSFNETRADVLAHSAADIIIGDFKQEIVNGSAASTVGPSSNQTVIYTPTGPANMLPVRSGNPAGTPDAIPNLIRISSGSAVMPAPGVGSRASAVNSTTDPSANGRSINLARWNKHYLIPRHQSGAAAVDSTPISPVPAPYGPGDATGFTPPDWVFVTDANGPQVLTAPDPSVNGRYAYAVYDEGGLLDLNAAGYPTSIPAPASAPYPVYYKPSLAFADLTVLPTSNGGSASNFPSGHVNDIVGWRNYASSQPGGDFSAFTFSPSSVTLFYNALLGSTTGFRTTATSVWNGRTDQMILSRQHLLALRSALVGGGGFSQDVLQYLGTFSRDLNQPSFAPDPDRPRIVSGDGGNDAYGADSQSDETLNVNPPFLKMRAAASFKRNDLTMASAGEPLVKKRFALNRLAWLTYKGPSVNRSQGDVDIQALISAGIPWTFLQQGTGGNISNYFGLTWDNANTRWVYSQNPGKPIETLSKVAAENREPNFIELLKAAVNVGAIAKGASAHTAVTSPAMSATSSVVAYSWEDYQFRQDISTDYAIIQLAANIIDQFDTDGYPTRIRIDTGAGQTEFAGVENLPYLYRTRAGVIVIQPPNPANQTPSPDPTTSPPPAPVANTGADKLINPGIGLTILEPELWNPHDANSSLGNPRPGAQQLQLVVDGALPGSKSNYAIGEQSSTINPTGLPYPDNAYQFSTAANKVTDSPAFYNDYQVDGVTLTAANTALNFSDNSGKLFREPTMLCQPGIPQNSNLTVDVTNNLLVQKFTADPFLSPFLITGPDGQKDCVLARNQNRNGRMSACSPYYFGIYLGVSPLRWLNIYTDPITKVKTEYILSAHQADVPTYVSPAGVKTMASGDYPATYRVQYKDVNGNWQTYDQKITDILAGGQRMNWGYVPKLFGPVDHGMVGAEEVASCIDPRTSRFGLGGGFDPNNNLPGGFIDGYTGPDPTHIDMANDVLGSDRIDQFAGGGTNVVGGFLASSARTPVRGLPYAAGWYPLSGSSPSWTVKANPGNIFRFGLFSQNDPNQNNDATCWSGSPKQNNGPANTTAAQYYTDPDGVARRAAGAYTRGSANPVVGLPLATATNSQSQSRPIILNRPFRSVADLGYVFSGTPWKNLDLFTPESGYAALLDVFCTADSDDPNGLVAGKVNLNTRQVPVLQAILAGAYQDEENYAGTTKPAWTLTELLPTDAQSIAAALVTRTTDTTSTNPEKGPLVNLSELVGKWTGAMNVPGGGIDGSKSYDGFSKDLTKVLPPDSPPGNIARFRDAAVRALVNTGQTRVWNLLIDVVAQSGHYPPGAAAGKLKTGFVVDGEQRYWVHVAIDRMTGQVLDKQIEVVKE